MAKVIFEAYRFLDDEALAAYRATGSKKKMFRFPSPVLKTETEDSAIPKLLEEIAKVTLVGTVLMAWKKDDNGYWDYCLEMEGTQKQWGSKQA